MAVGTKRGREREGVLMDLRLILGAMTIFGN